MQATIFPSKLYIRCIPYKHWGGCWNSNNDECVLSFIGSKCYSYIPYSSLFPIPIERQDVSNHYRLSSSGIVEGKMTAVDVKEKGV